MVDSIHRIGIKSPAAKVYKALSTVDGLAHWWTEDVEGDERPGGKIAFTFRSETGEIKGRMVMEILELIGEKMYDGVARKDL